MDEFFNPPRRLEAGDFDLVRIVKVCRTCGKDFKTSTFKKFIESGQVQLKGTPGWCAPCMDDAEAREREEKRQQKKQSADSMERAKEKMKRMMKKETEEAGL